MAARAVEFAAVNVEAKGGQRILSDVSLSVAPGEIVALLGRSGSGKTTLLRTVNALVRPSSGSVRVGERDVAREDPICLRRGIGYVIQETGLFPHRTIAANVGMPLELAGGTREHRGDDERVRSAMALVGLEFERFAGRRTWELSGGQRQRAGVARALVAEQDVLLMDEPFGALDPLTRTEMQTMLRELLRRMGRTTLIVTHDLDEALYLADRIVLLEQGSVAADLPVADVLHSENAAMQGYVRAARRIAGATAEPAT